MLDRHPAVRLCLPYIAGILFGWSFTFSPFTLAVIFVACAVGVFAVRKFFPGVVVGTVGLALLAVIAGGIKITIDGKIQSEQNIIHYAGEEERVVTIHGRITEPPTPKQRKYSFIVEVDAIKLDSQTVCVEGEVLASVVKERITQQQLNELVYGRILALKGTIRLPSQARNPGDFDYREYLFLRGIFAQCKIYSGDDITVGAHSGNFFMTKVIFPFRGWVGKVMDEQIGGEEAKLLKGLVIGERNEMDPDVKAAFTNAGLMHILAVSGLNVGLITIMFWAVFSLFRFPRLLIGILTVVSLILFSIVTGGDASVVRAVVMATVLIGAKVGERRTSLFNIVGIAALCILLYDARMVFDVGFELSFAGVLSLAYIYPKFEGWVRRQSWFLKSNSYIKEYLFLSVTVSFAATLGTLPLTVYYFHKVSILGVLLNLVAVPLSGWILTVGCIVILAASISSWLASVYAVVAYAGAWALLHLANWGGNLPFSVIEMTLNLPMAIGTFVLIVLAIEVQRPKARFYIILLVLLVANGYIYWSLFTHQTRTLEVTMLDVGQGDALVMRMPNGKVMLIDCGPRDFGRDAGTSVVVPYLKQQGIDTIDAVLISHPHADHMGGIPAVIKSFPIKHLFISDAISKSRLSQEVDSLKSVFSVLTDTLIAGNVLQLDSSVRIYVLHPFTTRDSPENNLNNHSLVIKVVYNQSSIILGGDAEEPVESELSSIYGGFLDSDIIKSGHHGSITSSSNQYLQHVTPRIALVSVGYKNKFHHPSPVVMERYTKLGCEVMRTDKLGAIVVSTDGNGWKTVSWRKD